MTQIISLARRQLRLASVCCLTCAVSLSMARAQVTQYAIISIEGSEYISIAEAINNVSQIGGAVTGDVFFEPFVWERTQYKKLGSGGGPDGAALDISDTGIVVGLYELSNWHAVPFVWTRRSGGTIALPYLDGFDDGSANAVNNSGTIVGYNTIYGQFGVIQAVRWDNGVPNALALLEGGCCAAANAIGESGWIVGRAYDAEGRRWPVLWHDGIITDLGALFEYSPSGEATALNDIGQVTGWSLARGGDHAFLWQDGEIVDIHDPYLGWTSSLGHAINNEGEIVGVLSSEGVKWTAFLWQPGVGMRELRTFVPPQSKWDDIEQAWDINDFGQIVGFGYRSDRPSKGHGYLMTPVYPTFTLDQPSPGIAGEVNTITARNLTPGTKVYFAYSMAGGGAIIPKCEIVEAALQIDDPTIAGTAIADANGVATLVGKVPSKWSGQEVLIQALVPSECDISNLIVVAFE